tara:strand:+ start:419 stop:1270 length:852 start_codon:yes stop_codon:yes gene_type:complete
MTLAERLKNAEEKYASFVAQLNKQRVAFKYFAMHQAFVPGDLLRVHIFPKVFDEDFMFCKFLEEFEKLSSRHNALQDEFVVLKRAICMSIYNKVKPTLCMRFNLFGSLRKVQIGKDDMETQFIISSFRNLIYEYMGSKKFELIYRYRYRMIITYSETKERFLNLKRDLKKEIKNLKMTIRKQEESLNKMKNYTSNFIIYQTLGQKRYNYVRFVKNCPKSIRVHLSFGNYARDNPDMLQLNAFEQHYTTTLIKKEEIVKVIDPKDIPQDQIKDGMVSIKFLDSM